MALFGRETKRDQARAANYASWLARQHPMALPSMLLSAFSLTHFGTLWVDTAAGIVLGGVALVQIRRARQGPPPPGNPGKSEGHLLAIGGILIGLVSLVLACIVYFFLPPHRS